MSTTGRLALPLVLACVSFVQASFAQTPSAQTTAAQTPLHPSFDVASIRASGDTPQGQVAVGVHVDGSQVRVTSFTLKDYIGLAYRMKVSQISGPDWIAGQRFDISATLPAGVTTAEIPEMFQALLAERFQLKFHREKREFPVYALIVGKGPLKVKESKPGPDDSAEPKDSTTVTGGGSIAGVSVNLGHGASWSFVPNHFDAKKLTMAQLAANLERFADRPIVDMTDLKGQYDLGFDINAEDYRPMLIRSAVAAGVSLPPQALQLLDGSSPAALADAVAQTGLKLEARKAPLDVIVVDDVLKAPTAN
jgi:uncharacterized protein (TIGR03435 family)